MRGDVVAFPDDDCWYPPDFLAWAARALHEHPEWDGLTGRSVDEHGHATVVRAHPVPGIVTRYNVWWRVCAITLFLRRRVMEAIHGFDESLGPGAATPWGGVEDVELVLRAVEAGFRIFYHPDNVAGHADPVASYPPSSWRRAYSYNCGLGRVLRTHRLPLWFVLYQWARPLGGMSLSLLRGNVPKAKFHWYTFLGRMDGWLGQPRTAPTKN
jgi:GT2 family glycosyltransferase